MKKIIGYILIVLGAILLVAFIIYNNKVSAPIENEFVTISDDGIKKNNSKEFSKTKKYKTIEITNINFEYSGAFSNLSFDVQNVSNKDFEEEVVVIGLLDKNEREVQTLVITFPSLKPQEKVNISTSIDLDVVDVYDFALGVN